MFQKVDKDGYSRAHVPAAFLKAAVGIEIISPVA